jgi:phospholipid/cholesterol/gamma-HCH transport system substrate-binding protein
LKFGFSKEVKVALLTIVSGAMLYIGFNFLKGRDTFSDIDYYNIYYSDVDGLTPGNPVYVNGLSVGQVKEMSLDPEHSNEIKVQIQLSGHIVLTDSTRAKLIDGSLLGGKAIVLELKPGKNTLADGATIPSYTEPGLTEALSLKAKPVIEGLDKTITNVNKILNEENQEKVGQILTNLESATKEVEGIMKINKAALAVTTGNLSKLSTSLVETEKQLKPILANLDSFSDSLKHAQLKSTVDEANKTVKDLHEVIEKLHSKNGTMGKLINEDSLYVHLDNAVKDLDKVFIDLKARPKRYIHFSVFGKKDK